MCYGTCPYQKQFSGECNNPLKNSKNSDAHCFEGFTCVVCNETFPNEDSYVKDNVCIDCATADKWFTCSNCGAFVPGDIDECYEKKLCENCLPE